MKQAAARQRLRKDLTDGILVLVWRILF